MSESLQIPRRWLQLSLRAMLAIVLLAALITAWLTVLLKRVHTQREAVSRVESLGGSIEYDYVAYWDGWPAKPRLPGPGLLRWAIGDDVYARVTLVYFPRPISDDDLVVLNDLPYVGVLHGTISKRGLNKLAGTIRLRGLSLKDSTITAPQLAASPVTSGISHLVLWESSAGDATVAGLDKLERLEMLEIVDTNITDAGLAHVAAIRNLRSLDLSKCATGTDAGLTHLQKLKTLRNLRLAELPLTGSGLKVLARLPQLESLGHWHMNISDRGLAHLSGHQHLKSLDLRWNQGITRQGAQELKRSLPGCRVEYVDANGTVVVP